MSRAASTPRSAELETHGWKLKLPASPPPLDDARLLEYRHPFERPALVLSLAALAALLFGAAVLEKKEVLVGIAGLWLAMLSASLQAANLNRLRGAEVTPTQFPNIHRLVEELSRRFDIPPTSVFVIRDPNARAEVFGFRPPYVVVLHSALLESLDSDDELRYVLGQQLGRIRFGHTLTAILIGGDESTLPALLTWGAKVRDLFFGWYRRAQVLSGDRAGILACGSVRVAIQTQVKLAVGTAELAQVEGKDLLEQAFRLRQRSSRFQAVMICLQSATPPLIHRLEAMVEWAGLPAHPEPT